jgi:hypothetical protein
MQIEKLRVVNDQVEADDGGTIHAPTVYFMDVALGPQECVAVPIGLETYVTLSNLSADQDVPEDPETPMGVPA